MHGQNTAFSRGVQRQQQRQQQQQQQVKSMTRKTPSIAMKYWKWTMPEYSPVPSTEYSAASKVHSPGASLVRVCTPLACKERTSLNSTSGRQILAFTFRISEQEGPPQFC